MICKKAPEIFQGLSYFISLPQNTQITTDFFLTVVVARQRAIV